MTDLAEHAKTLDKSVKALDQSVKALTTSTRKKVMCDLTNPAG